MGANTKEEIKGNIITLTVNGTRGTVTKQFPYDERKRGQQLKIVLNDYIRLPNDTSPEKYKEIFGYVQN